MALFRTKTKEAEADPVQLEGVSFRYGQGIDIFSDLTLTLPARSMHFLTGPSGAGKTSLLSLLYLAKLPSAGRLRLFGQDVMRASRARRAKIRRSLGVVFQDFRLLEHLSAFDNVALPLRVAGVAENTIRENVSELLRWVGLDGMFDAPPAVLSGGQKQRVAIARAVVGRPKLILADEPTGNVDDAIGERLMQLFVELHKLGACVIIASHNERLVGRFPYPRLHLDRGVISVLPAAAAPTDASVGA
ncbi:MAG: ATP-binding cassette domain-containing protein [Rhodospirillaceae bacterium]|nr:ATP-binding cassette domain-containing protein [Rhodospirillaceae bacterium]